MAKQTEGSAGRGRTAVSRIKAFSGRHPVSLTLIAVFLLFILLFDWNWLRGPFASYISNRTQRNFELSDLNVKLGLTPTVRMRDVRFSNSKWGKDRPMAVIKQVEFTLSLHDIFDRKITITRAAFTDADVLLERLPDNRRNWKLGGPDDTSPGIFRFHSISVSNGKLEFIEHGVPFELKLTANTFDPAAAEKAKSSNTKPVNSRYTTQYTFTGKYHDATFSGNALTGEVLSFRESGISLPIKGSVSAGTSRLDLEGTVADIASISDIDADVRVRGETMANLYPFLLLPLPASPPYELRGHLAQSGDLYKLEKLDGKIGSTDVNGSASYLKRKAPGRPLLTADLHSKHMVIADLGPLIGARHVGEKKPVVTQAQTQTQAQASAAKPEHDRERLLPQGAFDGNRLRAIDAEVKLETPHLIAPNLLPFDSLRVTFDLKDAVLKLEPLQVGFAGGEIVGHITLDAHEDLLHSHALVDFRRLQLSRLLPQSSQFAKAAGTLGAKIELTGIGNSIAHSAAHASGKASVAIANGQVSNLLDALSSLNLGKAAAVWMKGDKDISVNCGGAAFDVAKGQGTATMLVVDTEQTQITGYGGFDLDQESLDMTLSPKPKKPGVLSLRTPIHLQGSFRHPTFKYEKGPLTARAGAALALAAVSPLIALVPLLETGGGGNTDCNAVFGSLKSAEKQAVAPAAKAGSK